MKVKNIMFAGFAAAILSGVCGAASAADYNLVTEGYVTEKLDLKQDKLDNAETLQSITSAMVESIGSTAEAVADLETYVGTIPEGATATDVVGYVTEKTSGIASSGQMTELTNRVALVESDIESLESAVTGEGEGSVAKKISTALSDYSTTEEADALYAPADLSQTVSDLSATVADKADSSVVSALSGKVTTLENAGYQTAGEVSGAIESATSDMLTKTVAAETYQPIGDYQPKGNYQAAGDYVETSTLTAYQGTVTNALAGKQDTIENLNTIVAGAAKGATAVQPGDNVSTLTNDSGFQTETQVKSTIEGYGYQTAAQVEAEIAGATIAESQVSGLTQALAAKANTADVNTALAGKLAASDVTSLGAGTYLVSTDGTNVTYKSVTIVGATE